jgi:hypothetical protein
MLSKHEVVKMQSPSTSMWRGFAQNDPIYWMTSRWVYRLPSMITFTVQE